MNFLNDIERNPAQTLSVVFRFSMWWRIAYGTLRLFLGAMLLRVVGAPFSELFYHIMSHEVAEDKTDILFQAIYNALEDHSFTVTYFIASYLIFWGVIDIFLSIFLLRHKLWAFPVSLVLISFFVLYEIYRVFHTHSLMLLWIIIVDIFILYIINREYQELIRESVITENKLN